MAQLTLGQFSDDSLFPLLEYLMAICEMRGMWKCLFYIYISFPNSYKILLLLFSP